MGRRGWLDARKNPLPQKITLPQRVVKALGPGLTATRKAQVIPWSTQALQDNCAKEQPLFAGRTHTHMTLECVFRRLVRF